MVYIFLGPSGSGKDTQAKLLQNDLDIQRISTGELMRIEIRSGSDLGKTLQSFIGKGEWVPDSVTIEVLKNEISKDLYKNGFILTGFPRTFGQVGLLDELLSNKGLNIAKVIHFDLSEEESMNRMRTQATDKNRDRTDTSEEQMKARYNSYLKTIEPILQEYEKQGKLVRIDAAPSVEEIYEVLKEKLRVS